MAIERLDQDLCTGCGICIAGCPEDVLRMDEKTKKAVIMYPEDCVVCWFCESFCPLNCIKVSIGRGYELPLPY